mgnify:CR=1 FL=1
MELTRKECYDYIKTHNRLKTKIFNKTGWHYQNLTTEELNDYVDSDYNSLINRLKRVFCK